MDWTTDKIPQNTVQYIPNPQDAQRAFGENPNTKGFKHPMAKALSMAGWRRDGIFNAKLISNAKAG